MTISSTWCAVHANNVEGSHYSNNEHVEALVTIKWWALLSGQKLYNFAQNVISQNDGAPPYIS